ncbi:hypothetical protein EV714DRAFT_269277 [Schizophyllum commune]
MSGLEISETNTNDARRALDDEIAVHERAIRTLKSRRNTLAPIAQLPPEVLCNVFIFISRQGQTDYNNGMSLDWTKVSHVCRYWRECALDCPRLWSAPSFQPSQKWGLEMLKRSKMAPLSIRTDTSYMTPKAVDAVHTALQQIHRISELHITAVPSTLQRLCAPLNRAAPLLESLLIHANPRSSYYVTDEGFPLADDFLAGETPRLRRLELIRTRINWKSGILCDLTSLKIIKIPHANRPTITQMLDILAKMPNLRMLWLEDFLHNVDLDPDSSFFNSSESQADTARPEPVALPKLRALHLHASTLQCAAFLSALKMPISVAFDLVVRGGTKTGRDFSPIFPLFKRLGADSKRTIRSLIVERCSVHSIMLRAHQNANNTAAHPLFKLELSWQQFTPSTGAIVMHDVLRALPLRDLRSVQVRRVELVDSDRWVGALSNSPKLRSIKVVGDNHSTRELITALGQVRQSEPRKVWIPSLRSLSIEEFSFRGDCDIIDEEYHEPEDEDAMLEQLLDCLMWRQECRAPVTELRLQECRYIDDDAIARLEEVVVEVDWDGLVQGYSDDEDEDEGYSDYEYGYFGYPGDSDYEDDLYAGYLPPY